MFKKSKVCKALAMACGGVLLMGALPAAAQQRIEITGSAIKRVQSEGVAPVETYTKKDIERTGATTISELVKNISSLDIDDQGELTGNSPSGSGTQNLQIRGLSERNLLILLNGRRLPVNALHDGSGAGAAVDVNNIPLSAIERVEILKDGGSAIYGADAVAGVINFITKTNFTGVEARLGLGMTTKRDTKETPFGIVAGFGDYDSAGFNVLAALDIFKRDPLMRSDRDITSSADWRRFDGGNIRSDARSSFHPSGNILTGAGSPGSLKPCDPSELRSGLCRFDFNKTILTSINGADRLSSMVIGNLKLNNNTKLFGELTYSKSEDLFEAQPAPGAYVDAQGRTIRARFMQIGPRTTKREASLAQLAAGIDGSVGSIDYNFSVGQGTSKVSNKDKNYAATDLFTAAINSGLIDPTSTSNPESIIDTFRLTPNREGKSVMKFVNGKISGPLTNLAGGPLMYAVGFSAVRESLNDAPDAAQQAGNVFGSIQQAAVSSSRSSQAVFAELSIPIVKNLEAQAAVRFDRYPENRKTSPKIGLKWQPSSSFAIRGSYSESFLAPSLKQLYGGQDEGAESTSDADICAYFPTLAGSCENFPYKEVSGSNPTLKPETGKTYNIGIIFEPTSTIGLSVDWWRITKKDEINTLSTLSALANGDFGIVNGEAIVYVYNQNVAATKVEGVDFDVRFKLGDTPLGRLTARSAATWYKSSLTQFEPGDVFYEYAGSFLNPRYRNVLSVNLERGAWSSTVALRSTSSMRDTTLPTGFQGAFRTISAHDEIDLNVQYTGIKNLTLNATVKNLLDSMPPFSVQGTLNQYGSLGFPWMYSPRGRFVQLVATYKFF